MGAVVGFALLLQFGQGMVLPVLPLYAKGFGVGYDLAGALVGGFYLARLLGDLAAGPLVTRWGEAWSATAGLAALGGGAFLTGISPSYPLAVATWAVAGAGSSLVFASLYGRLLAVVPSGQMGRALSIFYAAFNGGLIAGGFAGGLVAARFGLATPLFLLALGAAALMPLAARGFRDGRTRESRRAPAGGVRVPLGQLLRAPGVAPSILSILAYLWMVGAVFNTLTPLFAHFQLGASTTGVGAIYAVALTAELVVLFPAGSWSDRYGRRAVLVPSLGALAVTTLVLGFAPSAIAFAVLMALVGAASGVAGVPPAAMLADSVPEGQRARAVAAFRFGGDIGLTAGPVLAGITASAFGFKVAFGLVAVPILLALAALIRSRETLVRES